MTKAADDVMAERARQVEAEGWTAEHDDAHAKGEMASAAGVYALVAGSYDYRWVLIGRTPNDYLAAALKLWPWEPNWFKPKDRRRDLVKAGALILAEIERIDRVSGGLLVELPKPKPSPMATPPRTMTRDDRRLIVAEIKGCWDEEKARYMDGWHDERIAQSLGSHVPKAWVSEVREDYFGESGSNEQFDEFIRKLEAATDEMHRIEKETAAIATSHSRVRKAVDDLSLLAKDVRRAIGR